MNRDELLIKAARCYLATGHTEKAISLLKTADGHLDLAILFRDHEQPNEAGLAFFRAEQYADALACFEKSHNWAMQVECLEKMEQHLAAAWVSAHLLEDINLCQDMLDQLQGQEPHIEVGKTLIELRTRSGAGACEDRLAYLMSQWPTMQKPWPEQMEAWAIEVVSRLDRPDLASQIFALNTEMGIKDAGRRWSQWSLQRGLGLPSVSLF